MQETTMLKRPTFHVDGDVIHITNWYWGRSIIFIVIAICWNIPSFVILPLAEKDCDEPELVGRMVGAVICVFSMFWSLFGSFVCLSTAFWWSVVVIDRKADEVMIRRRWGVFCSNFRSSLTSFDGVALREEDTGYMNVYLEGPEFTWRFGIHYDKTIVWGRTNEETDKIARRIASHLGLPLTIYNRSTSNLDE
jgi:hypothetical protein